MQVLSFDLFDRIDQKYNNANFILTFIKTKKIIQKNNFNKRIIILSQYKMKYLRLNKHKILHYFERTS
jgi:hypothetical protein